MPIREKTSKVIELAEEGVISWKDLAFMALKWMSEYDVTEMLKANEVDLEDDAEDEIYRYCLYCERLDWSTATRS